MNEDTYRKKQKENDQELEEIRKEQLKRKVGDGTLASFSQVSFDNQYYGSVSTSKIKESQDSHYVTSIAVDDDEIENEVQGEIDEFAQSKKQFLRSFSGPQAYFEDTRSSSKDEVDPFADFKKKTVGDKENEYQARWRKRKFSPPRTDAFAQKKGDTSTSTSGSSYKEVILNAQLDKEKAELLFKIAKKQKEEREEKERDERKRKKDLKKMRKDGGGDKTPEGGEEEEDTEWRLDVVKNSERLEKIPLKEDLTYNLGRGTAEIKLEHASCSKNHAKITFLNQRPNIMDLNSTNGTKVNGEALTGGEYFKLSDGDKLVFGCSTREFIVKRSRK